MEKNITRTLSRWTRALASNDVNCSIYVSRQIYQIYVNHSLLPLKYLKYLRISFRIPSFSSRTRIAACLAVLIAGCAMQRTAQAQTQAQLSTQSPAPAVLPAVPATQVAGLLALPPRDWAVSAAANELIALHHKDSYLRYRMHVRNDRGDQVRDIIESKDGTVARLILRDGRPLTEDEDQAERGRLQGMIAAPDDFFKHIHNEESGRKLADAMIRLMPDAMLYRYVPDQPQSGSNHGALEIVMDYEPNPKWKPPTTTSAALTGLKGRMWVDAKTRELVRMDGTIFQSVNFGWGMLAHIYPGGTLKLEQTNAGDQRWIYTHFTQQVTARALMVRTININTSVDADNYQTLPRPIPYQEAIKMLLDTPLPKK